MAWQEWVSNSTLAFFLNAKNDGIVMHLTERRLWTNERLVSVQRHWFLSGRPGVWRVCCRSVSISLSYCSRSFGILITEHAAASRPFFDKVTMHLPGAARPLVVSASGAQTKKYVKSLTVDGDAVDSQRPVITHAQIANGANVEFEMSDTPQAWGSATIYSPRESLSERDANVHARTEREEL